jgi:hypothetical protein
MTPSTNKLKLHKIESGRAVAPETDPDALLSFAPETVAPPAPEVKAQLARHQSRSMVWWYVGAVGLGVVTGVVALAIYFGRGSTSQSTPTQSGTAIIESSPVGAAVMVDGATRGVTPMTLTLTAGAHTVELMLEGVQRTRTVQVQPGGTVSHYVEFAAVAPGTAAAANGRLEIGSDPPGARVTIDGTARGTTPLTLASMAPGEYTVVIAAGTNSVTRKVTVAAGNTASIFASVAAPPTGTAAGWLTVQAPFELQILQEGRLIGTSAAERLMLPVGRHDLEFVNAAFEFRRVLAAQITAGNTSRLRVDVPNGSLSVNAVPWAEVFIDGAPVGTTPLGNLSVPVGSHDILWRHPQLGERRRTISVTANSPVRIGLDFNQ